MKFVLLAGFLLLTRNAFGQTCEEMLNAFLKARTNLETAGAIANDMYDNGCWGTEAPQAISADTCELLATMIVEATRGEESPVLKISGFRKLDRKSRLRLSDSIVLDNPAPGSKRILECLGTARFNTGNWLVQFYYDRYADGEEFWGLNPLNQR